MDTQSCMSMLFFYKKCYIHNIFITLLQQIINCRFLQIVISRQKSNFNNKFKLEPITTYNLRFFVKMLQTYHFFFLYNQDLSLKRGNALRCQGPLFFKSSLLFVNVYYVIGFRPSQVTCIAHLYSYYTLLVIVLHFTCTAHICLLYKGTDVYSFIYEIQYNYSVFLTWYQSHCFDLFLAVLSSLV